MRENALYTHVTEYYRALHQQKSNRQTDNYTDLTHIYSTQQQQTTDRHRHLRTRSSSKIFTYDEVTNTTHRHGLRTSRFNAISSLLAKGASGLPGTFSYSFSHWGFFPRLSLLNLPEENFLITVLSNLQLRSALKEREWRRQLLGRKDKELEVQKSIINKPQDLRWKTH